jgi:hypothetical protein
MKIGLAVENDVSVSHLMPAVLGVNRALKAYFINKEYGSDLVYIAIGTILKANSIISKKFHPIRPFKYKKLDRVKHPGTGQIMELHNSAEWDVMPDFELFSRMDLENARNYLCDCLIASTNCLEEQHSYFPDFDVVRFRVEFESCLRRHCAEPT